MIQRCLILLLLLAAPAFASAERPLITTSIHPLALIVKEVVGDQAKVDVLVPSDVSPHHYSMRPSERRRLEESDRIYWLGPALEPFLKGTLSDSSLSDKTHTMTPSSEASEDSSEGHHDHSHSHGHGKDPHIWLDPDQALTMAERVRDSVRDIEGVDQEVIAANFTDFRQKLEATEDRIRQRLAPMADMTLFTHHDAFHYFANHFGLTIGGTLTNNPERSPSARHLSELQEALEQAQAPCIMTEVQLGKDWWRDLDVRHPLVVSRWDPLGADIRIEPGGYTAFLDSLADSVTQCRPDSDDTE